MKQSKKQGQSPTPRGRMTLFGPFLISSVRATQSGFRLRNGVIGNWLFTLTLKPAPAATIAEELGITVDRVVMIAQDAREHFPKFVAGTCGCSRRSPKVRALQKAA